MFARIPEWAYVARQNADAATRQRRERYAMSMEPEHHHHDETPVVRDPEGGSGLVGYAAIKYIAIVAIVIAILVFLGWYLIPALTD
jgi:hypothetical protein